MKFRNIFLVFSSIWILLYFVANPEISCMVGNAKVSVYIAEYTSILEEQFSQMDPYQRQLLDDLYIAHGLDPKFIESNHTSMLKRFFNSPGVKSGFILAGRNHVALNLLLDQYDKFAMIMHRSYLDEMGLVDGPIPGWKDSRALDKGESAGHYYLFSEFVMKKPH